MWYSNQPASGLSAVLQAATRMQTRCSRHYMVSKAMARHTTGGTLAMLAWLIGTPLAHAEDTARLDTGDTAWVLISTALVLMMTVPGLALFYAGMVRKKKHLGHDGA